MSYNRSAVVRRCREEEDKRCPGPGDYNVRKSERFLKQNVVGTSLYHADSKLTRQQEKKRYWEEKNRDVREYHDELKETLDSFVTPHKPVVKFRHDNVNKRQMLNDGSGTNDKAYNIQYGIIEKKSVCGVAMTQQVNASQSSMLKRKGKPELARVLAEREVIDRKSTSFYGPQLPVQWVVEDNESSGKKKELSSTKKKTKGIHDDSGYESPTEEVLAWLATRGSNSPDHAPNKADSDTTRAYLRSSISGNLHRGKNSTSASSSGPKTRKDQKNKFFEDLGIEWDADEEVNEGMDVHIKRHRKTDIAKDEYLGPQLQVQWGEPSNADKNEKSAPRNLVSQSHSIRMDKSIGRDRIKVHRKSENETIKFNSDRNAHVDDDTNLGPGQYETESRVSKSQKGGVLFDNYVSRSDQIGPHGERPDGVLRNAIQGKNQPKKIFLKGGGDVDDILDAIANGREVGGLDVDKDVPLGLQTKVPNINLYTRDRYVEKEPKTPLGGDHMGGSWFQGMADNPLKGGVDFDRMRGREVDDLADVADGILDEVDNPGQLDLEVVDWRPSEKRVTHVRIAPDNGGDHLQQHESLAPELQAEEMILSPKNAGAKRDQFFADMSKQKNRWDDAVQGDALLSDDLGHVDTDLAIELENEVDDYIDRGKSRRRSVFPLPMSKQLTSGNGRSNTKQLVDHNEQLLVNGEVDGALYTDGPEDGLDVPAPIKGIEWNKQLPRNTEVDLSSVEVGQPEALDLAPQPDVLSKYRSNPGVSNWALQEGRISSPMSVHTSVNRLYVEEPAPNLDRNETSKKGYCMVQDVGRDADVDVLRDDSLIAAEELDLSPKNNDIGNVANGKNTDRIVAKWNEAPADVRGLGPITDLPMAETLDINPVKPPKERMVSHKWSDNDDGVIGSQPAHTMISTLQAGDDQLALSPKEIVKKHVSSVDWSKQDDQMDGAMEKVYLVAELMEQDGPLELDVNQAPLKNIPSLKWSNTTIKSKAGGSNLEKISVLQSNGPQENGLKLSPRQAEAVTKQRNATSVSWSHQQHIGASSSQQQLDVVLSLEGAEDNAAADALMLSPHTSATRKSIKGGGLPRSGNIETLTRNSSGHNMGIAHELSLIEDMQKLQLNPHEDAVKKRSIGGKWSAEARKASGNTGGTVAAELSVSEDINKLKISPRDDAVKRKSVGGKWSSEQRSSSTSVGVVSAHATATKPEPASGHATENTRLKKGISTASISSVKDDSQDSGGGAVSRRGIPGLSTSTTSKSGKTSGRDGSVVKQGRKGTATPSTATKNPLSKTSAAATTSTSASKVTSAPTGDVGGKVNPKNVSLKPTSSSRTSSSSNAKPRSTTPQSSKRPKSSGSGSSKAVPSQSRRSDIPPDIIIEEPAVDGADVAASLLTPLLQRAPPLHQVPPPNSSAHTP